MTQCSSSTAAAVHFTLLGFGAVVSEHDTMVEPLTVAFMNIGMTEAAFSGAQSERHCLKIQRQVHELRVQHNVTMYCFVEAGAPPCSWKTFAQGHTECTAPSRPSPVEDKVNRAEIPWQG